jgi:hypothetical protein
MEGERRISADSAAYIVASPRTWVNNSEPSGSAAGARKLPDRLITPRSLHTVRVAREAPRLCRLEIAISTVPGQGIPGGRTESFFPLSGAW